jgi:hypothetical protein
MDKTLATDQLYMQIRNDQAHLTRVFEGMFVAARRFIGFSPRGSSAPFITAMRHADVSDNVRCRDVSPKSVRINDAKISGSTTLGSLFLSFGGCNLLTKLTEEMRAAGMENAQINAIRNTFDAKALTQHLVDDYWVNMLKYAKDNARYSPHWNALN